MIRFRFCVLGLGKLENLLGRVGAVVRIEMMETRRENGENSGKGNIETKFIVLLICFL